MHVDGSTSTSASGAGVILRDKYRQKIEHAVHFLFPVTNNAAEYETLLAGVKLVTAIGIRKLKIHIDSQLIVGQDGGSFTPKEKKHDQIQRDSRGCTPETGRLGNDTGQKRE